MFALAQPQVIEGSTIIEEKQIDVSSLHTVDAKCRIFLSILHFIFK